MRQRNPNWLTEIMEEAVRLTEGTPDWMLGYALREEFRRVNERKAQRQAELAVRVASSSSLGIK